MAPIADETNGWTACDIWCIIGILLSVAGSIINSRSRNGDPGMLVLGTVISKLSFAYKLANIEYKRPDHHNYMNHGLGIGLAQLAIGTFISLCEASTTKTGYYVVITSTATTAIVGLLKGIFLFLEYVAK